MNELEKAKMWGQFWKQLMDLESLPRQEAFLRKPSPQPEYETRIVTITTDGGVYRIRIETEPGSTVGVTLSPEGDPSILTLQVQTVTSTTPR